jgi:hypothetical protein
MFSRLLIVARVDIYNKQMNVLLSGVRTLFRHDRFGLCTTINNANETHLLSIFM